MRKLLLAPILAFTLAVAGCGGQTAENETETQAADTQAVEHTLFARGGHCVVVTVNQGYTVSDATHACANEGFAQLGYQSIEGRQFNEGVLAAFSWIAQRGAIRCDPYAESIAPSTDAQEFASGPEAGGGEDEPSYDVSVEQTGTELLAIGYEIRQIPYERSAEYLALIDRAWAAGTIFAEAILRHSDADVIDSYEECDEGKSGYYEVHPPSEGIPSDLDGNFLMGCRAALWESGRGNRPPATSAPEFDIDY